VYNDQKDSTNWKKYESMNENVGFDEVQSNRTVTFHIYYVVYCL